MNKFILYWKHFFDTYRIYKTGDKFVVRINWLMNFIFWHYEWCNSGQYVSNCAQTCFMRIFHSRCELDSCQEAYDLIKQRKKYVEEGCATTKLYNIKKKQNRKKFAFECYK